MPISIDLEARRVVASVRDLAGEVGQRSIGLSGSGLSRLWIGQELHRRIQADLLATEPGYQVEVPVERTIELDGWTVELSGRADGVVVDGERVRRVDEIKTLHFATDLNTLYVDERLERFRNQARLYAWLLHADAPPPEVRLILVDIVSTEERDEAVPWTPDGVRAWVRQQLHRLVAEHERRAARICARRAAAVAIPFPHAQPRPSQLNIGEGVAASLGAGRHLLLQAPTGCGKTAAVLHPALQAALAGGHRLFFLTAKTLQQKLAVETLQAMQGDLFRSLQLRAKSKMCAHSEMICHEEFCPYAREYGLKLVRTQLVPNLLDGAVHQDPDVVFDAARAHEVCPFEVSLDLLPEADVVVCDYNYVFDPGIGLGALVDGAALGNAVLVIDEAHNLVDRSREYYSPVLDRRTADRATQFLASRDNAVFRHLAVLVDEIAAFIDGVIAEAFGEAPGPGDRPVELPVDDLAELRIAFDGAMLQYFLYKREHELWLANDPALDLFLELSRFHRVLGLGGPELVQLASRDADGSNRLRILCVDASRFVGQVLEGSAGTVAMSATLQPFEFYRTLLGFDEHRTDELTVPSPFPPENRLVLCIDSVDTTFRNRQGSYDAIASWIARLAPPDRNALVLFPSYAFLRAVHERLPPLLHHVVAQEPGASDARQRELLAALGSGRAHVLMAVLGGIYAEGVDYPGRMLSQVVVVSPGLPQYNFDRELLKSYYQEMYGHGFGYAYLVPGLTRVVQAAGRLLRSPTDRGVIALLCRRFQDPRYARLLPEEWTLGDPSTLLLRDPADAVLEFFAADEPGLY